MQSSRSTLIELTFLSHEWRFYQTHCRIVDRNQTANCKKALKLCLLIMKGFYCAIKSFKVKGLTLEDGGKFQRFTTAD